VTLQNIFGWVNAPFAFLMGVPAQDCLSVGQILGERIVLNEFVGYLDLTTNAKQLALDPRSFTIATYALCGFANFSSIAIQVGGIGSLAPERRSEMAKIGFRAMIGGLLARRNACRPDSRKASESIPSGLARLRSQARRGNS
jgi:concentrative nucleoside transporter, CNT family